MPEIAWPVAAVLIAYFASYVIGRHMPDIRAISTEWCEAFRYYTQGRAGLLTPPEPDPDTPPPVAPKDEEAEMVFNAWFDAVEFGSEEEAEYVRQQWRKARGLSFATKREQAEALRVLRLHAAPLPMVT